MPITPEGGCTHTGGEDVLPTNSEKGCADKIKIDMYTVRGRVNW